MGLGNGTLSPQLVMFQEVWLAGGVSPGAGL